MTPEQAGAIVRSDGTLEARRLVIQTPIVEVVLSLGVWWRSVVIDVPARIVTIDRRLFWLSHRREVIRFDEIGSVEHYLQRDADMDGPEQWRVRLRLTADDRWIHLCYGQSDALVELLAAALGVRLERTRRLPPILGR